MTSEEVAVYAKDADAIMTGWGHCPLDAEMLENTSIKLIVHTGGSVGDLVEQKIYEKGIKVISGNNLYADSVAVEEIFSTCKIVSLHSAMNERTRGMIGKEHFDLLQDGAIFINTARGAIIREDEMIEAMK